MRMVYIFPLVAIDLLSHHYSQLKPSFTLPALA